MRTFRQIFRPWRLAMQMHDAIRRAADHIEAFPQHYDFYCNLVPLHCDQQACALGWVGYFSGEYQAPSSIFYGYGAEVDHVAHDYLGVKMPGYGSIMSTGRFYARMDELCGDEDWMHDAKLCAAGLRAYAAMYHPRVSSEIPAAVRAIFIDPVVAA
jgi:hypothetical protein